MMKRIIPYILAILFVITVVVIEKSMLSEELANVAYWKWVYMKVFMFYNLPYGVIFFSSLGMLIMNRNKFALKVVYNIGFLMAIGFSLYNRLANEEFNTIIDSYSAIGASILVYALFWWLELKTDK